MATLYAFVNPSRDPFVGADLKGLLVREKYNDEISGKLVCMEKITFDNLPQAIAVLLEKIEKLEAVLCEKPVEARSQEKPMGVKEAAAFLELSIPTIYSKVCRGDLPAYKSGRKLYFDEAMLIKHIKSLRKHSGKEMKINMERIPLQLPKHQKRKAFRW